MAHGRIITFGRRAGRVLKSLRVSRKRLFGIGRRSDVNVADRILRRRIAVAENLSKRSSQKIRERVLRRGKRLDKAENLRKRSLIGKFFAGGAVLGAGFSASDFAMARRHKRNKQLKKEFQTRALSNLVAAQTGAPGVVANRVLSLNPRTSVQLQKRVNKRIKRSLAARKAKRQTRRRR